jgi:hypothetical protein
VTATIAYDRTVSNLIDELSATGHVTHRSYKKTSVTLHHNGGRLSHQGVLNVWKTRPASAHFDVDSAGAVAQYVKVNEYAWAVGNLAGNQSTISIEMANSKTAPTWEVADATWKNAARLAGWLFYKVIGTRPTKSNFFYHKHWSSTACAGPYMDKIYDKVLTEAQKQYDSFKTPTKAPAIKPKSRESAATMKTQAAKALKTWPFIPEVEKKHGLPEDLLLAVGSRETNLTNKIGDGGHGFGVWQRDNRWHDVDKSYLDDVRKQADDAASLLAANYKALHNWPDAIAAYNAGQTGVKNALAEGKSADSATSGGDYAADVLGRQIQMEDKKTPSSPRPSTPDKQSIDEVAHDVIHGKYGNGPDRVRRLIAAGYNASQVQARVDELLNPAKGPKSIKTLAAEVLAGKWGNDPSRSKDLREAGYDPSAVQSEVNRQAKARR